MGKWPHVDERVKHVGLTYIRRLNATALNELDSLLVVQNFDRPLAVIVPYEWFLRLQEQAKKADK